MNEVTLYIICLQLLHFVDVNYRLSHIDHFVNGILMVTLIFSNLVYNVVVIIKYAYDRWRLYWVRRKKLIEYRATRKDLGKINQKTAKRQLKLQKLLERETKKTW